MKRQQRIHPAVLDAASDLRKGKVNRREFLRFATLLGVSVPAAYALAGCAPGQAPVAPMAPSEGQAEQAAAGAIQRGGTWTSAMQLQLIDHPARMAWGQGYNVVRQVNEYLTEIGEDNIARPYLLEKWEANDDVDEWTLYLKQGVTFNNGDEMTADDVMYTFSQWLDPDVGSSMLGTLSYLDGMNSVEKVDDYTIKLYLTSPNISVPEDLFEGPAVILHRSFEGDWVKQPLGTGGFLLKEYAEGERAVLERRPDYWRMGEDGEALPYLDEIIYVSIDKDAAVAAMQAGQIDSMYQPRPSDWLALKDQPDFSVLNAQTSQCFVTRMRVDLEPWDDNRVRTALKMCQDREKILQLSYYGQGDLSIDAHVAPIHPEYAVKPIPAYDPEGALALLEEYAAEKGIELPLKVTLATKNDLSEPEIAQALKEQAAPGGFDITLDITDPAGYWDRWTEVDFGITSWTHRPLGTMILSVGYSVDDQGNPVPWNETRWVDEEFNTVLRQAEKTLDVDARREQMSVLEDIMQERGPIGNPYWKQAWKITRAEFQNVQAQPSDWDLMFEVWKKQ
ncbi:MAG: ABC transporter substrate-binding protein [Caldilineaceae bacterium]